MTHKRIGLRDVRNLREGETVWDQSLRGFGARRQRGSGVTFVLKYRTAEGRQRWYTIGKHGPLTPEKAREQAVRLLGDVARGSDPATDKRAKRKAQTVSQLCSMYMEDAEAGRLLTRRKAAKKASTLATDRGRIMRHIVPQLGRLPVAAVTREDVEAFMHAVAEGRTAARVKTGKKHGLARVRGGKGTATRTVGLLGAIFTYAVRHRMRPDNPVNGVTRFEDGRRERRLGDEEYRALGKALEAAESNEIWPAAISAARFLALTGWRSGEALGLRWDEVDLVRRMVTLPDSKTGRSERALSHAGCDVLRSMTRSGSLVFPATRGEAPMSGFPKLWAKIAKFGDLPSDVTPNVLRHSFASLAADLGYSEITIGALVGHKGHSVTRRYIHSADKVLLSAADAVADETLRRMGEEPAKGVVLPYPLAAA